MTIAAKAMIITTLIEPSIVKYKRASAMVVILILNKNRAKDLSMDSIQGEFSMDSVISFKSRRLAVVAVSKRVNGSPENLFGVRRLRKN